MIPSVSQDLIRSHVMEVVRPVEIQSMIDKGLMKHMHEYNDLVSLASRILPHKCDARCMMRIGPGDGPENFRCRKPHSLWSTPDPTCHQYVPFKLTISEGCIETLKRIGMCSTEDGVEQFSHPFFNPTRHHPPIVTNATENMSPIISEFFMLFRSMVSCQALDICRGTIAKYLLK